MSDSLQEELRRDLAEPMSYISQEAKHFVLDSLACHMHSKGYFIQGYKEENDAMWLARIMLNEFEGQRGNNDWERRDEDLRTHWIRIAHCAIACLPSLMGRVADRAIHYSQALRELERASRLEMKKLESERLKKFHKD